MSLESTRLYRGSSRDLRGTVFLRLVIGALRINTVPLTGIETVSRRPGQSDEVVSGTF